MNPQKIVISRDQLGSFKTHAIALNDVLSTFNRELKLRGRDRVDFLARVCGYQSHGALCIDARTESNAEKLTIFSPKHARVVAERIAQSRTEISFEMAVAGLVVASGKLYDDRSDRWKVGDIREFGNSVFECVFRDSIVSTMWNVASLKAAHSDVLEVARRTRLLGQASASVIEPIQRFQTSNVTVVRAIRNMANVPIVRVVRQVAESPIVRAAQQFAESPALRAAQQFAESPEMRAMQEFAESPAMRAAQRFAESPAMRAMQEFAESPAMRAAQRFADSPAMRAAQRFAESPAMRAIQELADKLSKWDDGKFSRKKD